MLGYLMANLGSILVLLGLVLVLGLVTFLTVRARRRGKSSCGCSGCAGCPMADKCHK